MDKKSLLLPSAILLGMILNGGMLNAQQSPSQQAPPQQQQEPSQEAPNRGQQQQPGQAPDQTQPDTQGSDQTFVGTIVKTGDKYQLKDSSGKTWDIDHQELVKKFEGKQVRVSGTVDPDGKTIHMK
jgi:hypothetical protein